MNIDNQPVRTVYQPKQYLSSRDLTDNQQYHIEMLRRHNLETRTWGIAYGLELVAEEGLLFVQPGVASDGYGRDIVLAVRTQIGDIGRVNRFDRFDIWLEYRLITATGRTRNVESPKITSTERNQRTGGPFHPDVSGTDQLLPASVIPSDNPNDRWPIFLGVAEYQGKELGKDTWKIDSHERIYAGLIASALVSPRSEDSKNNIVYIQNGSTYPNDQFVFGVYQGDYPSEKVGSETNGQSVKMNPIIGIRNDHDFVINATNTVANGAVTFLSGSPITFKQIPNREPDKNHFQIYHTNTDGKDFLRLSLPNSDDAIVQFGVWESKDQFSPILTINKDQVTVDGDLIVKGTIQASVFLGAPDARGGSNSSPISDEDSLIQKPEELLAGKPNSVEKIAGLLFNNSTPGIAKLRNKLIDSLFSDSPLAKKFQANYLLFLEIDESDQARKIRDELLTSLQKDLPKMKNLRDNLVDLMFGSDSKQAIEFQNNFIKLLLDKDSQVINALRVRFIDSLIREDSDVIKEFRTALVQRISTDKNDEFKKGAKGYLDSGNGAVYMGTILITAGPVSKGKFIDNIFKSEEFSKDLFDTTTGKGDRTEVVKQIGLRLVEDGCVRLDSLWQTYDKTNKSKFQTFVTTKLKIEE